MAYRIACLSDLHLFDSEGLYGMESRARAALVLDDLLAEHRRAPFDLLLLGGDNCNNAMLGAYPAGTLDTVTDKMGTGTKTLYTHTAETQGCSGGTVDPLGVHRMQTFLDIFKPLTSQGVELFAVHGNHDILSHRVFEETYAPRRSPRYIAGCYEDENGNLITDAGGKNYAIALDGETACLFFDGFDGENAGFTHNASGKNWGPTFLSEAVLDYLWRAVAAFPTVYAVLHTFKPEIQPALARYFEEKENFRAILDGHVHRTTVKTYYGKPVLMCGNLGIPMLGDQPYFRKSPWSYRILSSDGKTAASHAVILGHDYPAYTYVGYSRCTTLPFSQAREEREHITLF